jgi:prolipoprotein diacylglyceryltransferase
LFLFLAWKKQGRDLRGGFLTGWFLIILFTLRFVDEFFKLNQVSFEADLMLNMGQILSIPFVIIGIIILAMMNKKELELDHDIRDRSQAERIEIN